MLNEFPCDFTRSEERADQKSGSLVSISVFSGAISMLIGLPDTQCWIALSTGFESTTRTRAVSDERQITPGLTLDTPSSGLAPYRQSAKAKINRGRHPT